MFVIRPGIFVLFLSLPLALLAEKGMWNEVDKPNDMMKNDSAQLAKEAVDQVNAFFQKIMDKKAKEIQSHYWEDEDTYVFVEGPRYSTLGYKKIAQGWDDFVSSGLSLNGIDWVEGPFAEVDGDMAWVAGLIVLKVEVRDQEFEQKFRASFVLRRTDDHWKIRHEHVSGPLEDPYGIGDWLKKSPGN